MVTVKTKNSLLFVLSLLLLICFSLFSFAAVEYSVIYVDSAIDSEFALHDEVRVVVELKEDSSKDANTFADSLSSDSNSVVSLVDDLDNSGDLEDQGGAVEVERILESSNAVSVTLRGDDGEEVLSEIVTDLDVGAVYLDYPVEIVLDDSISQVGVDSVWSLDLGFDLTGEGRSVCVVDTGIDYTHEAIDGCSPVNYTTSGDIEVLGTSVESSHPYSNSIDETYVINMSGYENIALHFSNITLEEYGAFDTLDRVYVYNEDNETVAVYKGQHSDVWTPSSNGSIMYVRLVTDGSVTDYGFAIDKVINGTTNSTANWSSCSRVVGGYDMVNDDSDPYDDNGHGTHVSGIALSNDSTYAGVAPNSSLVAMKALNAAGSGYSSDIAAAVDYCVDNADRLGIDVITMSLACSGASCTHYQSECSSDIVAPAIARAYNAGIAVTIATGNSGWTDGISSPACAPYAIPIGSTDTDSTMSSFTNRGTLLSVLAPGRSITSTLATVDGGGFGLNSGTSMATPHVAGAIVLMQQYAREVFGSAFDPLFIETRLNSSGTTVDDESSSGKNYSEFNLLSALAPIVSFDSSSVSDGSSQTASYAFVNVSSDVDLSFALLEWTNESGQVVNITMTSENSTSFVYNMTDLSAGEHSYRVYGNDSYLIGETGERSISLVSGITATVVLPVNDSVYGEDFLINLTFSASEANLSSVNYTISNTTSSLVLQSMHVSSLSSNSYELTDDFNLSNSTFGSGNYTFTYEAIDLDGGSLSGNFAFYVDLDSPVLSSVVLLDTSVNTSDSLVFEVNVSDSFVNSSFVLLESNHTGSFVNYTMSSLDNYTFNYTLDGLLGDLQGAEEFAFFVNANDLAGNLASSLENNVTIQNQDVDFVNVSSHSNLSVVELGEEVVFVAEANDSDVNDSFSYVWNFSDSGVIGSGVNYSYVFNSTGNLTVGVNASDLSSSLFYELVLVVNDSAAPNISSLSYSDISTTSGVAESQTVRASATDLSDVLNISLYYDGALIESNEITNSSGNWTFGSFSSSQTDVEFIIEVVDNSDNLNSENYTYLFNVSASSSSSGGSSGGGGGGGGGSSSSSSSSSSSGTGPSIASAVDSGESDSSDSSSSEGSSSSSGSSDSTQRIDDSNSASEESIVDSGGENGGEETSTGFVSKVVSWFRSIIGSVTGAVVGSEGAIFEDASVDELVEENSLGSSSSSEGVSWPLLGGLVFGVLGLFGVYMLVRPRGGY